jgi:hypothetical protein
MRDFDEKLKEKLEEQRAGAERQRRGIFEGGGGAGAPMESDAAGYGMVQGNQVNQVMDKLVVVKMLYQRANEIEANARGIRRLAELVNAAGNTDFDLFAMILTIVRTR